jgi:hypothetical protein
VPNISLRVPSRRSTPARSIHGRVGSARLDVDIGTLDRDIGPLDGDIGPLDWDIGTLDGDIGTLDGWEGAGRS